MPANVVTLIMDSPEDELSCIAFSETFTQSGEEVSRGVISYYAALTLPKAANMKDWLRMINERAAMDVEQKKLNAIRRPKLKVVGDANVLLPGTAAK